MKAELAELVRVTCPICGGQNFEPLRRLNGYRIVRCLSCRFATVNPRPTEEAILRAYMGDSAREDLSFASAYASERPVESYGSWTGQWILKRFLGGSRGARFLDIGADHGWAVLEAERLGAESWGYEFGDDRSYKNDPRLNKKIHRDEKSLFAHPESFDRLFCSAVIEHVYHPTEFLKHWMRLLKPDGRFCVAAAPNLDSIFIRAGWDGWGGNIPPHHLNYFTPQTLDACVRAAGGEVLEIFTMGMPMTAHPRNMFRQRSFEEALDAAQAKEWAFAKPHGASPSASNPVVPLANHLLKGMGWGANLYVIFKKSGRAEGTC